MGLFDDFVSTIVSPISTGVLPGISAGGALAFSNPFRTIPTAGIIGRQSGLSGALGINGPRSSGTFGLKAKKAAAAAASTGIASDKSIDAVTRAELVDALSSDPSKYAQIMAKANDARAGVGLYGIRKISENQRNFLSAHPGRRQLAPGLFS